MKYFIITCSVIAVAAFAAAIILIVTGTKNGVTDGPGTVNTYRQISQDTAKEMMRWDDGHIIVDVRRTDEFESGHIPGAVCIPNEEIGDTMPEGLPDRDQIILVYCRSGRRSKEAAQKLFDIGYTNVYEFGGIIDWTGEVVTDLDVTFVNGVAKADVWILPETDANKKTTVWGKATVPDAETGEARQVGIEKSSDAETFIIRVIDKEGTYYSADGVTLGSGCTVGFKVGDRPGEYFVEVADANGEVTTYPMFAAKL